MTSRDIIVLDPPWHHEVWSKKGAGRTADAHYATMTNSELMNLRKYLWAAFPNDSFMCMWTTGPQLPFSIKLMEHWGWAYKTKLLTWVKLQKGFMGRLNELNKTCRYVPGFEEDMISALENIFSIGMGHYTRANPEFVIIGKRGKGSVQRVRRNVRELILAPIQEHSTKPAEANKRIELLLRRPQDRMFELFARRQYNDWVCTGLELDGLDIKEALMRIANGQLDKVGKPDQTVQETVLSS